MRSLGRGGNSSTVTDTPHTAILLMAYGSPGSLDDVPAYFRHIRGGREPSPEAVANLHARYAAVGGHTPLLEHSRNTADELARGTGMPVYLGMKHWHPFIAEVVSTMLRDGVERIVAIPLAPHYSRISVGGYRDAIDRALATHGVEIPVLFVDRWHDAPEFLDMLSSLVREGLQQFGDGEPVHCVFSAHSLPERIRTWNDPYETELKQSAQAVAAQANLAQWSVAWQSAGSTGEPWIGPDILDHLQTLAADGVRRVLQVPIGFVSEHLEILWDIDVEAAEKASTLGIEFRRTALPNSSPALVHTLAAVAARRASAA